LKPLALQVVEIVLFIVQIALGIALPAWIVRWDERRLPQRMLERAWNPASFWMAVVVFGPLCLPVHFGKTRRSVGGVLLGFVALASVVGLQMAMAWGFEALSGE
jgi:hypothetical protein